MDNWMEELGEHLVFISELPQEVVEREGLELGKQLTDMTALLLESYYDCVKCCTTLSLLLSPEDRTNLSIYWQARLVATKVNIEQELQEDIDQLKEE